MRTRADEMCSGRCSMSSARLAVASDGRCRIIGVVVDSGS